MRRSIYCVAVVMLATVIASPDGCLAQEREFRSTLQRSVGGVYTVIPDAAGSLRTNPAVIALADYQSAAELSYRRLYGLAELEDLSVDAVHRFGHLGFGIGLSRFGQSGLYQETEGVIGAAFRIERRIGIGVSWSHQSTEYGDGEEKYAGSAWGGHFALRPIASILAGVSLSGLTADRVYESDETAPILDASIAWLLPPDISLGAIWTRERDGTDQFGLGQVLQLTRYFDFLSGLRFDPVRYSLGGRLTQSGVAIVYAYQGHPDLGATHNFGLLWSR